MYKFLEKFKTRKGLSAFTIILSAILVTIIFTISGTESLAVVATCPTPSPTGTSTPYVQPGSVGYLGSTDTLTVYQPGGAVAPGCSWQSYGMRCNDDNVTLDHVWVKGGIYWTGVGTLKVTNSIVQGGTGSEWYAVLGHPSVSGSLSNSFIDVENSTVGWLTGKTFPSGYDVPPVLSLYGNQATIVKNDDLSGMPQGVDPDANSIIVNNYIHGLVQNKTSSGGTTHLDGVFSQGGGNILVQGNYIDAPVRSDTTASVFIQNRGSTDTGINIIGNYLNGGAYNLRNQTGIGVNVENNTFGSNLYGFVGDVTGYPGTYGTWSGNADSSGNSIPKP